MYIYINYIYRYINYIIPCGYINYIIPCEKGGNHQVPKIVRVPGGIKKVQRK